MCDKKGIIYCPLVIIEKYFQTGKTESNSEGGWVLIHPEGKNFIFSYNDQRGIHYPAYYMATCQSDDRKPHKHL